MVKLLIGLASVPVVYGLIALGLILSDPARSLAGGESFDFAGVMAQESPMPRTHPMLSRERHPMPDGTALSVIHVRDPDDPSRPLIVMVHGSSWHGGQFEALAWALRDVADSMAVTLRGHGAAPERRGDIGYIGQFEDDLAHLIAQAEDAGRKIILLGHSSGGGLAVRFAGGAHGAMLDGAILLAPFLQFDAPSTKAESGGWARVQLRRVIGLVMLNRVGVTALNGLPVIQFNMPETVLSGPYGHYATTAYSYRLNTSFAPRRAYLDDIAALPAFLLVAGAADEAFFAEAYQHLTASVTGQGCYVVIPQVGHLGIVDHPETEAAIREYVLALER